MGLETSPEVRLMRRDGRPEYSVCDIRESLDTASALSLSKPASVLLCHFKFNLLWVLSLDVKAFQDTGSNARTNSIQQWL